MRYLLRYDDQDHRSGETFPSAGLAGQPAAGWLARHVDA